MTLDLIAETRDRSGGRARRVTGGKLTGQKPALKMKEVWSIRARLELKKRVSDLALFNLAMDSKLRGCDLVRLKVDDVAAGAEVKSRGIIVQKKTGRPVQFEITEQTRTAIAAFMRRRKLHAGDYLFPSRLASSPHLSTRQYARIVRDWVSSVGLNPASYGTHSLRRTKAALIYRKTAICEPFSFYWNIPSLKARCAIWASRSMTPSRFQRASICDTYGMAGSGSAGHSYGHRSPT